MTYLKRNINTLLFVIVIILVGFVLTLVGYYENNYDSISDEYYERVGEYQDVIAELQAREQALNQTSVELSKKTQDTQKLGQLYTEVEGERDELATDLIDTKEALALKSAELVTANVRIKEQESTIATLENDISLYEDAISDIKSDVSDAKSTLQSSHGLTSDQADAVFDDIDEELDSAEDIS